VNGCELGLELRCALQILQERADARVIGLLYDPARQRLDERRFSPGRLGATAGDLVAEARRELTVGETCANPLDKGYRGLGDGSGIIAVRIPTKPAMHSNLKPATYSDLKPAGVPI
jgi:hypothetical protein